jgi:oligopeptide transport system substrate-binding protein
MSLRTRRSSVFFASLILMAVACSTGSPTAAPATQAPATQAPASEAPASEAPASEAPASEAPASEAPASEAPASEAPASEAPSGEMAPPDQQVLRLYFAATDPRSLQPQAASGSDEISVIGGIQRGLLYYDQDLGLVPELAQDMPEVSEDGLTYTYHLKPGLMYSDGTPIVAGDFVRAARSLADPRNAFDYGYEMCWLAGAADVLGTDFGCASGDTPYADPEAGTFDDATVDGLLDNLGVAAPDDQTVVFTLATPTSFWPNITAMWLLTPVPEAQTSWAEAADIISSGPYMMDSWAHNQQIVLVPNPNWAGDPAKLQRVELNIGGDPAAAVAAFERGDLDMVGVPSSDIRRVLDDPNLNEMVNRGTTLSIEYYDFADCPDKDTCPPNDAVGGDARIPGGSPTQNKEFRAALTQALDRNELLQVGFAGIGQVAYSPTMPGIPGFPTITDANNPYPFDPAAAREHLSTALDELGIGQPDPATILPATDACDDNCQAIEARAKLLGPMRFGYNCDAGHDQRVLYIAQAWRNNLGFTGDQMDIRCTDFGTFRTERRAGNVYSISRNGWGADFPHPDNQNRDLFACGAGNNNSKYCNEDYDALLNQGAQAADYDTATPFYQQAETLLAEDAPVVFLRYGEGVRLIRPWVAGIQQTSSDHQNVGDVFYETMYITNH